MYKGVVGQDGHENGRKEGNHNFKIPLHFQQDKHKKHDTPHHPMTKDQLEEVWEEQDHMRAEDWDPKTFFAMHDLNGDGHWDEDEVKVRNIDSSFSR